MHEVNLQLLLDEHAIRKVLDRYCWGVDNRSSEALKDCYWPEATDDHGIVPAMNAHDFVNLTQSREADMFEQTMHVLGQAYINITGSHADTESYLIAYHQIVNNRKVLESLMGDQYVAQHGNANCASHNLILGSRYLDQFERRGSEWRIIKRVCTVEWELSEPTSSLMSEGVFKTAKRRGTSLDNTSKNISFS